MNSEQITNIAIKLGEIGQKTNFSFWIAIISAVASIICAAIAGVFAWKLNKANKQHEKQWAYVSKRSLLIDHAIEIFSRMLFNKLILANRNDNQASENLFLLQKDALVVESQLVVYGSIKLAMAFYDFKNLILQTPNESFREKWGEIYQKGHECLLLCRADLGVAISEEFKKFVEKLKVVPIIPEGITIKLDELSKISLKY